MGPGGMPPGAMMPGLPRSGTERLASLGGLYLKQKMDPIEAFLPYEKANKYVFFPIEKSGAKFMNKIFKAKEKSDVILRQFAGPSRPFQMIVKNTDGESDFGDFLFLDRQWVCCQCNKGDLRVTCLEGGQNYVGRVHGPCTCCGFNIQIFDAQEQLKYQFNGDCCQCGVQCGGCPCESCRTVMFTLNDASGAQISEMKRTRGLLASVISDADDFMLMFPPSATPQDRMLLLAAMIFMDFAYFEAEPGQSNDNPGLGIMGAALDD
jgi:hypothetical protein